MFDLAMAYKDSDYTIVIAVICWPKCVFSVLNLTLVLELQVYLSSHRPPLLKRSLPLSLAVQLSGKAHEDSDYTALNAFVDWCLHAETHPGGEVVSTLIIIYLPSG